MFYADTQARAAQAESTFAERRARRIDEKTQGYTYDYKTDIYGEDAALNLWANRNLAAANERLRNTALWFDQPHPHGRDPRGESTFAALGMAGALYHAPDRLEPETKRLIDRFFLEKNFESMYESENHRLLHHTALYLAAMFYADQTIAYLGRRGGELLDEEEDYLKNYILYRAGAGWGEFDSYGYMPVVFKCLLLLRSFARDERLRKLAVMMLDILLLDVIMDSVGVQYGGAHGRIYPPSALNAIHGGTLSGYYFGGAREEECDCPPCDCMMSDYRPGHALYELAVGRNMAYVNKESKHLHCIPQAVLEGRISKYTYVTPRYIVGAINRQDPYPEDSAQEWYAHHEQHEMDAMIVGEPRAKVFTHHPGDFKEHNQWTGDLHCRCVQTFCDKNVILATYDIHDHGALTNSHVQTGAHQYFYINAYMNRDVMERVEERGGWMFAAYGGVYIALYGSGGFHWIAEADRSVQRVAPMLPDNDRYELVSDGKKHGVVIEISDAEDSLEQFIERILSNPVSFDPETMRLAYTSGGRTVEMQGMARAVNGVSPAFPYKLFDSPYAQSETGSRVVRVAGASGTLVYDFNKAEIIAE